MCWRSFVEMEFSHRLSARLRLLCQMHACRLDARTRHPGNREYMSYDAISFDDNAVIDVTKIFSAKSSGNLTHGTVNIASNSIVTNIPDGSARIVFLAAAPRLAADRKPLKKYFIRIVDDARLQRAAARKLSLSLPSLSHRVINWKHENGMARRRRHVDTAHVRLVIAPSK